MTKPKIFLFDPPGGLIASELTLQVIQHGFVVFSANHSDAKELAGAAIEHLAKLGTQANYGQGRGPNFLRFLLDFEGKYEFTEFADLVTEFDWDTTAPS